MNRNFIFLLNGFLLTRIYAKHSVGVIDTASNWVYLERFCFLNYYGTLRYTFKYPRGYAVQKLYLYYDSASQWPLIYRSNYTCQEREDLLDPLNNQIVQLTPDDPIEHICTYSVTEGDEEWLHCQGENKFAQRRARWWYLAIGNCNTTKGLYLEYDLLLTNGEEGLLYHFSADELLDLLFLMVQFFVLMTGITIAVVLRSRHMLHQTYKLFLLAISLEIISRMFLCYAYLKYAQNGEGKPKIKVFGQLFRAGSTITYLVLLLLLAKGYTVTRGRLSRSSSCKLTILTSTFTATYMALFTWQTKTFDPGMVTYVYESPSGYCTVALRILAWLWYCISTYKTIQRYPTKREFYIIFSAFMTIWFWMGPISVCIANFLLDPWVREEGVNMVDNAVMLYGFVVFLILTRPSSANRNFPFHVRTTQIDCVNNFPQNAYEVQYSSNQETAFAVAQRPGGGANGFTVNDYRGGGANNSYSRESSRAQLDAKVA